MRHGETVWNLEGRIQGHRHVPLTERGRMQARQLALRLAGAQPAALYSSDLSHALATAQELADSSGAEIRTDPWLREFSYGAWEGLTMAQAKERDPEVYAERIARNNTAMAAPGGETTLDLLARVRTFCDAALKRHGAQDDVTVVAHGGTIRAVAVSLLGLDEEHFWRLRLSHGSLSVVTVLENSRVLELWNDTGHLQGTASRTIP